MPLLSRASPSPSTLQFGVSVRGACEAIVHATSHLMSSLPDNVCWTLAIAEATFTPGHALQVEVQRKLTSHLSACSSAGIDFIPIVAEGLRGLAEDTITIVPRLGDFIRQRVGQVSSGSTPCKQLFHRLAIALWRGNTCLWLHRQPTLPSVDDFVQCVCVCVPCLIYLCRR